MSQFIKISKSFFTEDTILPKTVSEIEIGDKHTYEGAFGYLYECITINRNIFKESLLVKILKEKNDSSIKSYDLILNLQRKIRSVFEDHNNTGYSVISNVPGLKAFPVFSFEGLLNEKIVRGYACINLADKGFISLDYIFNEDNSESESFKNLPFIKKFQFCFHLAKGFEILEKIYYVHADINPKNLFVNIKTGECAIIDYDGGCITNSSTEIAQTIGKFVDGEWMAPEIYEKERLNQCVSIDTAADKWSVATAFHFLMFNCDPFFFVKEQSKICKEAYLKANKFHPINVEDPNVSENTLYGKDAFEHTIATNIPDFIYKELVINFEQGFFHPEKRTNYSTWVELFKRTQKGPEIITFKSDKRIVVKGSQVRLFWQVNDAQEINLNNGIGEVTGKDHVDIRVEQQLTYYLTAKNHFYETQQMVEVSVMNVPVIEHLKIPRPDVHALTSMADFVISPAQLNVSIRLEKDKLSEIHDTFIPLAVAIRNTKPSWDIDSYQWSVSALFDKIKNALNQKS